MWEANTKYQLIVMQWTLTTHHTLFVIHWPLPSQTDGAARIWPVWAGASRRVDRQSVKGQK